MSIKKKQVYGAVVVYNDAELRDPKAVAAREVQKRFNTRQYVDIPQMIYVSILDIWVAIFRLPKREKEE